MLVSSRLTCNKLKCARLIASLHSLSDSELPHAILRYTLERFENVYWAPSWWESLNQATQESLFQRLAANVWGEPNALKDDGIKAISWTVTSRDTNIAL
jgi:hypothetical protein